MRYLVCGVADDGLVELYTTNSRSDAVHWLDRYTRYSDGSDDGSRGGYDLIEVYDQEFAEDPAECIVYFWENQYAAVEAD